MKYLAIILALVGCDQHRMTARDYLDSRGFSKVVCYSDNESPVQFCRVDTIVFRCVVSGYDVACERQHSLALESM